MRTLFSLMLLAAVAVAAPAADVTGKWSGTFVVAGGDTSDAFAILKQAGSTITGSAGPDESQQWPLTHGKLEGSKFTGEVANPNGVIYKLSLTVAADKMKGDVAATTPEGQPLKATLELTRLK